MEARIKVSSSWGKRACLGTMLFLSIVSFLTFGIDFFSELKKLRHYTLAECEIEIASARPLARFCCNARPSDACVAVHPGLLSAPKCVDVINNYTRANQTFSPCDMSSLASSSPSSSSNSDLRADVRGIKCAPPAISGTVCDGGHLCCQGGGGGLSAHKCYEHGAFLIDCQACFATTVDVRVHMRRHHKVVTTKDTMPIEMSFNTESEAEDYLRTHKPNTTVTCYYQGNDRGQLKVVFHGPIQDPIKISILTICTLVMVMTSLILLISTISRAKTSNNKINHTKVFPSEET